MYIYVIYYSVFEIRLYFVHTLSVKRHEIVNRANFPVFRPLIMYRKTIKLGYIVLHL